LNRDAVRVDAGLIGPRRGNMIADYIGLALPGQYKHKVGVEIPPV